MATRVLSRRLILSCCILIIIAVLAILTYTPQALSDDPAFLASASVTVRVRSILVRACADCHSERTRYPWYSFLPMVSRTIENDISRGRQHLNFSQWNDYSRLRRQRALTGIADQVKDGLMPLAGYVMLHPSARLSSADRDEVFDWAQQERLRLIMEGSAGAR
jgi:heme-binding protein